MDHPYLLVYSAKNAGKLGARRNAPAVANGSIDCDLCHEPPTDRVVSSCCGAAFCRGCVIDFMSATIEGMDQQGGTRCPSCRAPFTVDLSQESKDLVDDSTLQVSGNQRGDNPSAGMPSLKEMTHVSSGSILRRINLAEFATSTKIEALVEEYVLLLAYNQILFMHGSILTVLLLYLGWFRCGVNVRGVRLLYFLNL